MVDKDRLSSETALLVFDMINVHVKTPDGAVKGHYAPILEGIVDLVMGSRDRGLPIIFAYANHRQDNKTTAVTYRDTDNRLRPIGEQPEQPIAVVSEGSWGNQIIDDLSASASDFFIPKYRWSAFHQTYLDLLCRTMGIKRLVLLGGSTDVGIASTAFSARDLDYHLIFAHDGSVSPEKDNHEQFMRRIFPRMGIVRSVAEIWEMLDH
ncbi:MAG: cysteine hydrolase [Litorivicinaceae bacterium]